MKDYRKIYQSKCNITIPKDYEIHHIDFNRKNNEIMNLVMLPKELHKKYHRVLLELQNSRYEIITKVQSNIDSGNLINDYISINQHEIENKFIKIWYECQIYVDYRNYLLGLMPNIHNINLRGNDACI